MGNNNNIEIERKFLIKKLPDDLASYPSHKIVQAYICTSPVIRIRQWDADYILTDKAGGLIEAGLQILLGGDADVNRIVRRNLNSLLDGRQYYPFVSGEPYLGFRHHRHRIGIFHVDDDVGLIREHPIVRHGNGKLEIDQVDGLRRLRCGIRLHRDRVRFRLRFGDRLVAGPCQSASNGECHQEIRYGLLH